MKILLLSKRVVKRSIWASSCGKGYWEKNLAKSCAGVLAEDNGIVSKKKVIRRIGRDLVEGLLAEENGKVLKKRLLGEEFGEILWKVVLASNICRVVENVETKKKSF